MGCLQQISLANLIIHGGLQLKSMTTKRKIQCEKGRANSLLQADKKTTRTTGRSENTPANGVCKC